MSADAQPLTFPGDGPVSTFRAAIAARGVASEGVWLVGGAVRDAALGTPTEDVDVVVEGDAHAWAQLLAVMLDGEVVARHAFGTATVAVPAGAEQLVVDIASARTERYERPGALPTVELGASIDQDLARRDFTINTLAVALDSSAEVRFHAGTVGKAPATWRDDLDARQLRVLHESSFRDDPTRLFRAARYAGRLGFELEPETAKLARLAVADGALATLSPRRLGAEIELTLREPACAQALAILLDLGVFAALEAQLDRSARAGHELVSAVDHACATDETDSALSWHARFAALALEVEDSALNALFESWATRNVDARSVRAHRDAARTVRIHADTLATLSIGEVRELLPAVDEPEVLAFAALATHPEAAAAVRAYADALHTGQLELTGHEIMALGVPRGPLVGRILDELRMRRLSGQLHSREEELAAARELAGDIRG